MTGSKKESKQGISADNDLRIVGIGASAGGMEALGSFLKNVPPASGLAFVIVQHLDPKRKDMMAELLQRYTPMPVAQIRDGMPVAPDHVYVIPPNHDLSLLLGVLHLHKQVESAGLRLPVDTFFRSLAEDQGERGIGVILSGMGSDGTLGVRSLKEKGGIIFVQSLASAQFDGMPRSAINTGLIDAVAPVEELPGKIISYLQHVPSYPPPDLLPDGKNRSMEKIILLLRTRTGHDFSLYKKSTIYRRIERRMALHKLLDLKHYESFLRSNAQEIDILFKELMIGVTNFFRDPTVWEQLKVEVLPALLAAHRQKTPLRAWVTACSTGEEAYSLAIVFREVEEELGPNCRVKLQIFATDLDKDAVDKARVGVFPPNIAADVSEERLRRFFTLEEGGYRVKQNLREMVIFAPQNLIADPPFTKLDLLTCRNLLIYLEPDLQQKLLSLFHYSLKPDGFLMLGKSESIGQSNLFTPLPGKARIYRRLARPRGTALADFSPPATLPQLGTVRHPHLPPALPNAPNLPALTDELLLRQYMPAAVLTTHEGDIIYFSAKTGKYLEPTVGKANMNIFSMAREGLAGPLDGAFGRAMREKETVTLKDLRIKNNGGVVTLDVDVRPLSTPAELQGMVLIVFREGAELIEKPKGARKNKQSDFHEARLAELARELQLAREEVQITREEMQASQEELKAANEELQSTNEELQSTNEELTTSKEEMQSMNEELQTINQELTSKVDELSRVRDDMENILNSTEIATLFLDDELRVRRFTPKATKIFKLIPGDTGRPITDQVNDLDYPAFARDIQQVLQSLSFCERQVATRDGRWFSVRIMPYRTRDNRIDGVVITFFNISGSKQLEKTMSEALSLLQTHCDNQTPRQQPPRGLPAVLQQVQALLQNSGAQKIEHRQELVELPPKKR